MEHSPKPAAKELRISKRTLAIVGDTLLIKIKLGPGADRSLSISTESNPLSLYSEIINDG